MAAALLALGACGRGEVEDAVAATLPDPQDARFQSVARHGDAVCGEVNPGGARGTGKYTRFVYRRSVVSIAPRVTYTPADVVGFEATCSMLGGQGNGLDRQVCTRAANARRAAAQAAAFDKLWQESCGGSKPRTTNAWIVLKTIQAPA